MFRGTQANPFDDVVAKATDENLTSENWEFIMEAVDQVDAGGDTAARDVVAALIKRLAHRNAQVQIYTLETANALSQNCGVKIHRELSSRAFTDALLRLAGERTTHQAVKSKILERMEDWAEMFSKDPELGIMEQAYIRLKSQNPNLQPPSKPTKSAITDVDRQKEEEDLARALEISLQETRRQNSFPSASASTAGASTSNAAAAQKQPETKPEQPPANATAATVSRVRALYDFVPTESGELAFRKGDIIAVLESVYKDWWKGSLRGQTGIFPLNYVEKLADPTVEELQREAQTEAEVFAQIKNVEKLLSMLSTTSADQHPQDNEEITALYHQTLAVRPKLIDLISKYQQKRDDFAVLNEKFVKARKDYESLLDTSMSNPAAHPYPRPFTQNYGNPEYGSTQPTPQNFYGQPGQHTPPPLNTTGPYGPPDVGPPQGGLPYPVGPGNVPPAGSNPASFYGAPPTSNIPPDGRKPSSPQQMQAPGRGRIPSGGYHEVPPQELATHDSTQDPSGRPISPNGPPAQSVYKSYYTYNPPPPGSEHAPQAGGQGQGQPSYPPQYLNNRPQSWVDPNAGGASAPPPAGNPADYYRNELFLPGGAGGARTREG